MLQIKPINFDLLLIGEGTMLLSKILNTFVYDYTLQVEEKIFIVIVYMFLVQKQ